MRHSLYICIGIMSLLSSGSALSFKTIHGVPRAGWRSPDWNWGSAVGTGHDCARISRQIYATPEARRELIDHLLSGQPVPEDFEEVKLALALFLQKSAGTGRDGGVDGYGDVLAHLARAERYEDPDGTNAEECAARFIRDMQVRFCLLEPTAEATAAMARVREDADGLDDARRRCCGLVLEAMGYVEDGP